MAVNDEVQIGSIFVLAHARFCECRVAKSGEAARDVVFGTHSSVHVGCAVGRVGVEVRAVDVRSYLEPAMLEVGNAVVLLIAGTVSPHGKRADSETAITRRRTKEEHVLPTPPEHVSENVREEFRQPGPAGKDEHIRLFRRAQVRSHVVYSVLPAGGDKAFDNSPAV